MARRKASRHSIPSPTRRPISTTFSSGQPTPRNPLFEPVFRQVGGNGHGEADNAAALKLLKRLLTKYGAPRSVRHRRASCIFGCDGRDRRMPLIGTRSVAIFFRRPRIYHRCARRESECPNQWSSELLASKVHDCCSPFSSNVSARNLSLPNSRFSRSSCSAGSWTFQLARTRSRSVWER